MKIVLLALVVALATAHPMKEFMDKNNIPETMDGSLHLIEGTGSNCINAGPFQGCCAWDGARLYYGWNVNDTILSDATYNVTWNPFAIMFTGLQCQLSFERLFAVQFASHCGLGYTHVPLTVLFNGNMNENSFLSYLAVNGGRCHMNVTSAFYECIWQENVIGGPSCGFTPPRNHGNVTYEIPYYYQQNIWPN